MPCILPCMEKQPTTDEVATRIAAELDAAHDRARRAYRDREAAAYIDAFHTELKYTQCDGRTISREQLAQDLWVQLAKVRTATSEFQRESLDSNGAEQATETLVQQGRFEIRAFGIVHREWTFQRRGRYE